MNWTGTCLLAYGVTLLSSSTRTLCTSFCGQSCLALVAGGSGSVASTRSCFASVAVMGGALMIPYGWWSPACLGLSWQGECPSQDHKNRPFPAGTARAAKAKAKQELRLGGACIAQYGDWQWFKAVLGLRGWRGEGPERNICWVCGSGFTEENNC